MDLDGILGFVVGDFSTPLLLFVDSELLEAWPDNCNRETEIQWMYI